MAGDVNLYWNDHDDGNTAEIEIMIAEEKSRGKGMARQALLLFMSYAIAHLVRLNYVDLLFNPALRYVLTQANTHTDTFTERSEVSSKDRLQQYSIAKSIL